MAAKARLGKSGKLTPTEIEKFPKELEEFWRASRFDQFLCRFKDILSSPPNTKKQLDAYNQGIIQNLPLLSELAGRSTHGKIHSLIQGCYLQCDTTLKQVQHRLVESLRQSLAISCNTYVLDILCTSKEKLVPYTFIEWCLKFSAGVLNKPIDHEEQTLKVEEEFMNQSGSPVPRGRYILQHIALEFMTKLYIYPLNSKFPERPGVYFIYYVGKTNLYEGSPDFRVSPSKDIPVYVGQSQDSISERLTDHHRNKILKATNLSPADFVVRFMILDINYNSYALTIEKMMIKYFMSLWNSETTRFSFGNARSDGNKWHQYHIQGDEETVKNMLK